MKNHITSYKTNNSFLSHAVSGIVLLFRLLLLFLLMLSLLTTPSLAQSFDWTAKISNTFQKTTVTTDYEGNTYVLASFSGNITIGGTAYTSYRGSDVLLVKYKPGGLPGWVRRIGGTGNDQIGDLTLSYSEGTLFIAGSFQSKIKFEKYDGSADALLTSAGSSDVFIAMYCLPEYIPAG